MMLKRLETFYSCLLQAIWLSIFLTLKLSLPAWAADCTDQKVITAYLEVGKGSESFKDLLACDNDAIPTITIILETSDDPLIRGSAADALGEIRTAADISVPVLTKAFQTDAHPAVKFRAISALAKLGADAVSAIPALTAAAQADISVNNAVAQKRAAYALGKISFALQGKMEELTQSELDEIIQNLDLAVEVLTTSNSQVPEIVTVQHIDDVQVSLKALTQYRQSLVLSQLRERFSWTWLSHILLWLVLISAYPKYPSIQAIFFWNPWVRRLLGVGYVGIALTWIPFLRTKLFAPFKDSLLADADLENFSEQNYFSDMVVNVEGSRNNQPILTAIAAIKGQLVLEGESGLGKSMFLRHLAKSSNRILVFIPAKRCNKGVMEAIQAKLHGAAKDADFLRSLIYSGALDICIDGLNEVTANTRAQIVTFAEGYFKGNIIMATQPIEWQPPSTAKLLTLQPLNREQIEQFLVSRYSTLSNLDQHSTSTSSSSIELVDVESYKTACKHYLNQIFHPQQPTEEWQTTQRILSNPMDLTFVAQALAKGEQPDLFNLQSQQYQIMAEDYQKQYLSKFPIHPFAEMAYQMRLNEQDTIPSEQFFEALTCMERYKMVLSRQTVDPFGEPTKEWFFRHDKIMEFFIVQTFLGSDNNRPEKHLNDARFRGVYLLLATLLPFDAAMRLRELLIRYAADSRDHSVSDTFIQLLISREASS